MTKKKELIKELESLNQRINKMEENYENLRDFHEEIKKIVREKGKSNYISREEIENLIVKYPIKENVD